MVPGVFPEIWLCCVSVCISIGMVLKMGMREKVDVQSWRKDGNLERVVKSESGGW